MALPNLAVSADLSARGVDVSNGALVALMLAVASATVREAAGRVPILETDSVVTCWGLDRDQWLDLPGKPVTAVETVVHDGDTLTAEDDYKLVDSRLWGSSYWGDGCEPLEVVVTLTHGLAAVPEDIKQLVCDLTIAGMNAAAEGARSPGVIAEKIDDYSVTYAQGAEAVASAMTLPKPVRVALRKRFGGGAGVVASR